MKKSLMERIKERLNKTELGKKISSIGLAAILTFSPTGSYAFASSYAGEMTDSNIETTQVVDTNDTTYETQSAGGYQEEVVSDTSYHTTEVSDVDYSSYDSSSESYTTSTVEGSHTGVEVCVTPGETTTETVETTTHTGGGTTTTTDVREVEDVTTTYETVEEQVPVVVNTQKEIYEEIGHMETVHEGSVMVDTAAYGQINYNYNYNNNYQNNTQTTNNCKVETKCAFKELLKRTTNVFQKHAMYNLAYSLLDYNTRFAECYVEEGKDVKASLSFEEMVALQMIYNGFTKEQVIAYFNGTGMTYEESRKAYESANVQLLGSYIMEDTTNTVDLSRLITSEEGKAFYHKYHNMFLEIKKATGQEKITKIEQFYKQVHIDFSSKTTYESYMYSVAPMISAVELMYRNVDINYTLTETEVEFLQDIGLCKRTEEYFKKVEQYTSRHILDKNNPTYLEFREAIINILNKKCTRKVDVNCTCKKGQYVDNSYRDLCKLDTYQKNVDYTEKWVSDYTVKKLITVPEVIMKKITKVIPHINVNKRFITTTRTVNHGGSTTTTRTTRTKTTCPQVWQKAVEESFKYTESLYEKTDTHTDVATWTVTDKDYREIVTKTEKEIPCEIKEIIDQQMECENVIAKEEAKEEAEVVRQELQEIEDAKAEQINKEIEEEEKDLQEKIEVANNQIELNHDENPANDKQVNEKDLGHGVDFFDEYSDIDGNLKDYVEEISTDSTGDQTGNDLPDPEVTGREFDEEGNKLPVDGGSTVSDDSNDYETQLAEMLGDITFDTEQLKVDDNSTDTTTTDTTTTDTQDTTDGYTDGDTATTEHYEEYVSDDGSASIEYPDGYTPYVDASYDTNSYESAVNDYVESMASSTSPEVGAEYQYSM